MPDCSTWVRRRAAVAGLLPLAVLLAACGSSSAKPAFPSDTPALWNPCDALDPALVLKALGSHTKEEDGTPTAPVCKFAPLDKKSGEALVTANYQLSPIDLETFWKSMHPKSNADVERPTVPAADDARIVIDHTAKVLAITGFVQNGDLFQLVNVIDAAPYDRARDIAGTITLLTALSQHADQTGAGASATPTATMTVK